MKDRFYLACFRDNVGENVAWHGVKGGYTSDVSKAEEFTLKGAQKKWDGAREFDQPISADHVDQMIVWKVDMQYIPNESQIDENKQYVAFVDSRYSGNDRYFITNTLPSINFDSAKIFSKEEIEKQDGISYIPFVMAEKQKRRTFDYLNYNPRMMVQGAGLKMPKRIKKYRRRKASGGKVRWNCPKCGKINWQFNPYDFDGCSDFGCQEAYIGG